MTISDVLKNLTDNAAKKGLVLDAGCGSGGMPADHVGIDLSRKNAKLFVHAKTCSERMVVVSSIEMLPFRNNAFHTALCSDVLEHVQNKELAIRELCRTSKQVIGCTSNLLNPFMFLDTILPRVVAEPLSNTITAGHGGLEENYKRSGLRFTTATITKIFQVANVKAEIAIFGGPISNRLPIQALSNFTLFLTMRLHIPVCEGIFFRVVK